MRNPVFDKARGFAIILMIVDHILKLTDTGQPIRQSLTRFSMPLFFVISGHLVHRYSWRLLGIGILGLIIPLYATWLDSPNVLVWYAIGSVLIIEGRRLNALPWIVIFTLALAANFYIQPVDNTYWAYGLFGLMALGASINLSPPLAWFDRLPNVFAYIGGRPLSIYVGQAIALTMIARIPA